jgi:hypothetical protein
MATRTRSNNTPAKKQLIKGINHYLNLLNEPLLTADDYLIEHTSVEDFKKILDEVKTRQADNVVGNLRRRRSTGGSGSGGIVLGSVPLESLTPEKVIAHDNKVKQFKEKSILEQQSVQDKYLLDLQNKQNTLEKLRSDLFAKSIATEFYVNKDGTVVQKPTYLKLQAEARVTTSIGAGVRGSSRNNKSGEWTNDQLRRHMVKLRV